MRAARSWARRAAEHFLAALVGGVLVGVLALAQWSTAVAIVWPVAVTLAVLAVGEAAVAAVLLRRAKR